MEIGSKLKAARQNADYTQERAATELNVSRQTISNWENNKTYPELSLVIKMSDIYNISLDSLLKENSDYTHYINESTAKKKLKIHLSVIIEAILFLLVWGAILFSYYAGSDEKDWVSYVVMVYVFIFPPIIFLFSAVVGADPHWGRFKWVLLPIFAYSVCFMDFCTFNTDSLFTKGDVLDGIAIEFLPFFMISFIGMLVGSIVYGAYTKRKAKKENRNGIGN